MPLMMFVAEPQDQTRFLDQFELLGPTVILVPASCGIPFQITLVRFGCGLGNKVCTMNSLLAAFLVLLLLGA
jgi:hypothetical protein